MAELFTTDVTWEITCPSQDDAKKLVERVFSEGKRATCYIGSNDNKIQADVTMSGAGILLVEGMMEHPIAFINEMVDILEYLIAHARLSGLKITYTDDVKDQTGIWTATRAGVNHEYLPKKHWPNRCDSKDDDDWEDMLDEAFEKYKITETFDNLPVMDRFVYDDDEPEEKVAANEAEKHSDGITLNEYYTKKIENAIEAIAYIDSDFISKIGKAPEVLRQVVNLANAVLAIFQGEAGNELSDIAPLSGEFQEMNNAASDFKDALDSLSEYK